VAEHLCRDPPNRPPGLTQADYLGPLRRGRLAPLP
jgi:hypothetical protein